MERDPISRAAYRRENFLTALALLERCMAGWRTDPAHEGNQLAAIKSFEMAWELGWKLLADEVTAQGIVLPMRGPRAVIRTAFMAGLIADGDGWMAVLEGRNETIHSYLPERALGLTKTIETTFLPLFERLAEHGE